MLVAHPLSGGPPLHVRVRDDRQQELFLDREVVPPVLLPEPVERRDGVVELGARGPPQPARRLERVVMVAGEGCRASERFIR